MAKIVEDAATTMPTPPRGKRRARGGPRSVKTRQAKAIAHFLWSSVRKRSAASSSESTRVTRVRAEVITPWDSGSRASSDTVPWVTGGPR